MLQSAKNFPIANLGDLPNDIKIRFRRNDLHYVQELLDEGVAGCLEIGLKSGDIKVVSEMLHKNDFERLT